VLGLRSIEIGQPGLLVGLSLTRGRLGVLQLAPEALHVGFHPLEVVDRVVHALQRHPGEHPTLRQLVHGATQQDDGGPVGRGTHVGRHGEVAQTLFGGAQLVANGLLVAPRGIQLRRSRGRVAGRRVDLGLLVHQLRIEAR
jgi:hypothetical protein